MREIRIGPPETEVSASLHGEGGPVVVLGHGAGGNRKTPFLLRCAETVAASGRRVLLYNFPYSERSKKALDPPRVLEAVVGQVAEYAWKDLGGERVVLGGKSMGGRIASMAVAGGVRASGLVFLGYPLHPPGRPEKLRDRHLGSVRAPMLFLQGTRDAFARWDLIETAVDRLGENARLERFEDADHSFVVPKRSGRSSADTENDVFSRLVAWLQSKGL